MAAGAKRPPGELAEDVVCGFLHDVTETRVSMRGRNKLFNAVIQVSREEFHEVVVFAPEKRTSFVQAEKSKSPVKLSRVKRRVGSDGCNFNVQCGRTTEVAVLTSLPFPNKRPPEKSKLSVADVVAMAPRQHVAVMEVRVVHVSEEMETVEVNGVFAETQACFVEDASGFIKLQLWEAHLNRVVRGSFYRLTNLSTREFGGKAYITSTWSTEITKIDHVPGLKSVIDFVADEEEVATLVTDISAAEVKITHRCSRCQAWQEAFDGKSRFHRCLRCNKLQNTSSFQATVTASVYVTGFGEEMSITNSVIKTYLTKESLLNLLADRQDLEEHLMLTAQFKLRVRHKNIIGLARVSGESSASAAQSVA